MADVVMRRKNAADKKIAARTILMGDRTARAAGERMRGEKWKNQAAMAV
jgi:hypothetical protein